MDIFERKYKVVTVIGSYKLKAEKEKVAELLDMCDMIVLGARTSYNLDAYEFNDLEAIEISNLKERSAYQISISDLVVVVVDDEYHIDRHTSQEIIFSNSSKKQVYVGTVKDIAKLIDSTKAKIKERKIRVQLDGNCLWRKEYYEAFSSGGISFDDLILQVTDEVDIETCNWKAENAGKYITECGYEYFPYVHSLNQPKVISNGHIDVCPWCKKEIKYDECDE